MLLTIITFFEPLTRVNIENPPKNRYTNKVKEIFI